MNKKDIEKILSENNFELADSTITPEMQGDMIRACAGKDEDGNSNCTIMYYTFSFEDMTMDKMPQMTEYDLANRFKPGIEKSLSRTEVDMYISDQYLEVVLTFETGLSPEIRLLLNQLEIYRRNRSAFYINENDELPQFEFNFYPRKYNLEKYITCGEPIFFALQPEKAGLQNMNKLMLVFSLDTVRFEMIEPDSEEEMKELESYLERTETDAFLFTRDNK